MEKTKVQIASEIVEATQSIEVLDDKIAALVQFAEGMLLSDNAQVELSMEEFSMEFPYIIKPIFETPAFNPTSMAMLPPTMDNGKQMGWMKVYTNGMEGAKAYHVMIPKGTVLKFVDFLLVEMKQEREAFMNVIDQSISDNPKKTYTYSIEAGNPEK